ncbi:MAG: hypothetical protein K5696_04365 [Lachnospiraceae bacterium]|nr:hypothetical protein [Lachnospiraceae bacterium]
MPNTRMVAKDIITFASGTAGAYPALFGTPGADIAKRIALELPMIITYETDDPDVEDINGDTFDEPTPHRALMSTYEPVTEEMLRSNHADALIDELIGQLESEIATGNYKEGTIQRDFMNYMLTNVKALQKRELVIVPSNLEANDFPGIDFTHKVANYGIIPKLARVEKKPAANGQGEPVEEMVYPEGFAAEDRSAFYFTPREDQNRARFTMDEFQTAADKINFSGFNGAGSGYGQALRDFNNMLGMQEPISEEQDRILRERVLAATRLAKQELQISQQVSPDDQEAAKLFDGNTGFMGDTLFAKGRGFDGNIRSFEQFERYLESGLPIAGFNDYKAMLNTVSNLENGFYKEHIKNTEPFENAVRELSEKLEKLPEKGASKEAGDAWRTETRTLMRRVIQTFHTMTDTIEYDDEKIRDYVIHRDSIGSFAKSYARDKAVQGGTAYKDVTDEYMNAEAEKLKGTEELARAYEQYVQREIEKRKQEIADEVKTSGGTFKGMNRLEHQCLVDLEDMGRRNVREKRAYVQTMMSDMVKTMGDISKELQALAKKEKNLSPALQKAINKAVSAGDPDFAKGPKSLVSALNAVQKLAAEEGREDLKNFAKNEGTHIKNRMLEAESKGILPDESLNAQIRARARNGREHLSEALTMFNTRRSKIFGSWNNEQGKESPEHKALREATETLKSMQDELKSIKELQKTDPGKWIEEAKKVQEQAKKVAGLAGKYMREKEFSAGSKAGKQRLAGAIAIYQEAELTRVGLKQRAAALDRYAQIAKSTEKMMENFASRTVVLEEKKKALEAKNRGAQKAGEVQNDPKPQQEPKKDGEIKVRSFNDLKKALEEDKPEERTFHGRKSVGSIRESVKEDPVLDNEQKKKPAVNLNRP